MLLNYRKIKEFCGDLSPRAPVLQTIALATALRKHKGINSIFPFDNENFLTINFETTPIHQSGTIVVNWSAASLSMLCSQLFRLWFGLHVELSSFFSISPLLFIFLRLIVEGLATGVVYISVPVPFFQSLHLRKFCDHYILVTRHIVLITKISKMTN